MGKGASVQWSTISRGVFRPLALEYDPVAYWGVLDESSDFLFPVLVDENEGVVFGVSGVVLVPSFPRVY